MKANPRYIRQYPVLGLEGQERLAAARVLVVGTGGIGSLAAPYLVGAGVGNVGIIDDDRVSLSNLHRQVFYTEADIGTPKASCLARHLNALNPSVTINTHLVRLHHDNAVNILRDYDVVMDGSDNFVTRYLVNDVCCLLRRPFVSASVLQTQWQVAFFDSQQGCYRCLYPEAPPGLFAPNCNGAGVLGASVGMAATFATSLILQHISQKGSDNRHKLYRFDTASVVYDTFTYAQRADCPGCVQQQISLAARLPITLAPTTHTVDDDITGYRLIDVREPWEVALAVFPGAENVPLSTLPATYPALLTSEQPCLYICKVDGRSRQAWQFLGERGQTNGAILIGGITAWMNAHGKTLPY